MNLYNFTIWKEKSSMNWHNEKTHNKPINLSIMNYKLASLMIGTGLYILPSILPKTHKNKVLGSIFWILRIPGIAIRAVLLGSFFFLTLFVGLILVFVVDNKFKIPKMVGVWNHNVAGLLFGVTAKIANVEKLQTLESGVVIFNHQSFFDGMFLNALWNFVPGPVVGVAKAGLSKWPLVGWYWRSVGGIFVENSHGHNVEDIKRNIELVNKVTKRVQDEKLTIFLSPEGHRSSLPTILPFKKGAFHMAVNAQVPIVPVVVQTFYDKIMDCSFPWSPQQIDIEVLDPIPTKGMSGKEDVNALTDSTHKMMVATLNQLNKNLVSSTNTESKKTK